MKPEAFQLFFYISFNFTLKNVNLISSKFKTFLTKFVEIKYNQTENSPTKLTHNLKHQRFEVAEGLVRGGVKISLFELNIILI